MEPRLDSRVFPELGRVFFERAGRSEACFQHREIVLDGDYLRHGIELEAGATIFDVGANIGMFSLFAFRRCGGHCSLFAFEPVPRNFRVLQRNAAEHGLADRPDVALFDCGLTRIGASRSVELSYYPRLPGNSTSYPELVSAKIDAFLAHQGEKRPRLSRWLAPLVRALARRQLTCETVLCRMSTLTEIVQQRDVSRIDLLKIDVEGAELDVLEGADDATWRRIRQVVLETHDLGGRLAAVESTLRTRGFDVAVEQPAWAARSKLDNHNVFARRRGEAPRERSRGASGSAAVSGGSSR